MTGATREDLDDRPHGIRTPQRRLRAADDFHPFDFTRRDAAEIKRATIGVDADAVDEHEVVVGLSPAGEDRRQGALTAAAFDAEAGHEPEHVGQRRHAKRLDVRSGRDGHGFGDRRSLLGTTRGGDDQRVGHAADLHRHVAGHVARGAGQTQRHVGKAIASDAQLEWHAGRNLQTIAPGFRGHHSTPHGPAGHQCFDGGLLERCARHVGNGAGDANRRLRRDGCNGENLDGSSTQKCRRVRTRASHGVSSRRPSRRCRCRAADEGTDTGERSPGSRTELRPSSRVSNDAVTYGRPVSPLTVAGPRGLYTHFPVHPAIVSCGLEYTSGAGDSGLGTRL